MREKWGTQREKNGRRKKVKRKTKERGKKSIEKTEK